MAVKITFAQLCHVHALLSSPNHDATVCDSDDGVGRDNDDDCNGDEAHHVFLFLDAKTYCDEHCTVVVAIDFASNSDFWE